MSKYLKTIASIAGLFLFFIMPRTQAQSPSPEDKRLLSVTPATVERSVLVGEKFEQLFIISTKNIDSSSIVFSYSERMHKNSDPVTSSLFKNSSTMTVVKATD